jgi:hypothetical protein
MTEPKYEFELLNCRKNNFVQFDTYEEARLYAHGHKSMIEYALIEGTLFSVYYKIPFTSRQEYDEFVNQFNEKTRPLVIYLLGRFHRSPPN